MAALILCCISGKAQKVSQEWLTDAFDDDLKVGTRVCVTTSYSFSRKFGEKIIGDEKKKTVKMYDEHGFYTQVGETTYKNTYLPDGRISEVDVFEEGKLKEKKKYSYTADGVARLTYNSDGKETEAWGTDGKGTEELTKSNRGTTLTKATLNSRGNKVKESVSMSAMNGVFVTGGGNSHSLSIMSNYQYNEQGILTSCLVQGMGRSQSTEYSDYTFDEAGNWISRFETTDGSPERYDKRTIYTSEEDYAKYVEEVKRLEAERIAQELEAKKQKERDYLAAVKTGKETPAKFHSTATYSVDKHKAAGLIEQWMQAHLENGKIVTESGYGTESYEFDGFTTSATFEINERGKVNLKSNDDEDLWRAMPFKGCKANAIRLETLDSVAYIPTNIELQIGQPRNFNFKSVILQLKYDKKTQGWTLKNEKALTMINEDLKKRMLDFVLSKPFMQDVSKRTVVVRYDAYVEVLLRSKDKIVNERIKGMTVLDIESFK